MLLKVEGCLCKAEGRSTNSIRNVPWARLIESRHPGLLAITYNLEESVSGDQPATLRRRGRVELSEDLHLILRRRGRVESSQVRFTLESGAFTSSTYPYPYVLHVEVLPSERKGLAELLSEPAPNMDQQQKQLGETLPEKPKNGGLAKTLPKFSRNKRTVEI